MSIVFKQEFERSLDALVSRFSHAAMRGQTIQAWLFDDQKSRRLAEVQLKSAGVDARFRSAYKPLLHFFLEEVDCDALANVIVSYPSHQACAPNRFLLETYPLAKLIGDATVVFQASGQTDFTYQVALTFKDGGQETHQVFAPNHQQIDFIGETVVSPTGWLITDQAINERLETDYEQLFHAGITAIAAHDWGTQEPYFEELNISVPLPITDYPLPYAQEVISLREALHEDIYFTLLEVFQKKSGRPVGDRGLQPGQIVPDIEFTKNAPSIRIETRKLSTADTQGPDQPLAQAKAPLFVTQIGAELDALGGKPFTATTRSGRLVRASYIKGSDQPVMISAGQHANETTGVVGALRAAQQLLTGAGAHFTISPQENPDGYELHRRLCKTNPHHMHHAARYTALGDDLEYRSGDRLYEKAIRVEAEARSGAKLHINLHGYPSHEWTRPLSGYIPRGFGMWTLPKGFFLIMRHHSDWSEQSETLIDQVTRHLADIKGLVDYNNAQIKLFEQHAGETGFRIINGFPCLISIDDRHNVPMTLITEYPDETIYGEAFIKGHTAQMETVLSAYAAFQHLKSPLPNQIIA